MQCHRQRPVIDSSFRESAQLIGLYYNLQSMLFRGASQSTCSLVQIRLGNLSVAGLFCRWIQYRDRLRQITIGYFELYSTLFTQEEEMQRLRAVFGAKVKHTGSYS